MATFFGAFAGRARFRFLHFPMMGDDAACDPTCNPARDPACDPDYDPDYEPFHDPAYGDAHRAARVGDVDALREMSDQELRAESLSGTPMTLAIIHGHLDAVLFLKERCPVTTSDTDTAALNGHLRIVDVLPYSPYAVHAATSCMCSNDTLMELIARDPNALTRRDSNDMTPLMCAVHDDVPSAVETLCRRASPHSIKEATELAVRCGSFYCFKTLLGDTDPQQWMALALQCEQPEITEILVEKGAGCAVLPEFLVEECANSCGSYTTTIRTLLSRGALCRQEWADANPWLRHMIRSLSARDS